jgi:pimeloyl-ACP methyl ester carboxylesterase
VTAPAEISEWLGGGRHVDVLGRRVFVRAEGSGDPPILFLHGFPTCGFDLRHALPLLAAKRRVIVHDHLGFGLSDKPADYSYSLFEQTDVALGVWRALGVTEGHVVSHDYGTSIANELAARAARGLLPIKLASLTFTNGSMLIELAKLRVTQQLLRNKLVGPLFAKLASYRVFRAQMRRIFGKPDAVPERELELAWWLMQQKNGRDRMAPISGYIDERFRFRGRWASALEWLAGSGIRSHVLWANRDPICVVPLAEEVARLSRARLTWLDALGHYPMLEDPQAWANAALDFIEGR